MATASGGWRLPGDERQQRRHPQEQRQQVRQLTNQHLHR